MLCGENLSYHSALRNAEKICVPYAEMRHYLRRVSRHVLNGIACLNIIFSVKNINRVVLAEITVRTRDGSGGVGDFFKAQPREHDKNLFALTENKIIH